MSAFHRIGGSVVEFSPATRETGVRFPANAFGASMKFASWINLTGTQSLESRKSERGHPGLNRRPLDLQSNALPLSYIPSVFVPGPLENSTSISVLYTDILRKFTCVMVCWIKAIKIFSHSIEKHKLRHANYIGDRDAGVYQKVVELRGISLTQILSLKNWSALSTYRRDSAHGYVK